MACPNCGASIRLVPKLLGRRVFCNTCRSALQVSLTLKQIAVPRALPPKPERQKASHDSVEAESVEASEAGKPAKEFSESSDDLVFGLPEVAEDPFPGSPALLNSPETSEPAHVGREPDWENKKQGTDARAQPIGCLEYGVAETGGDFRPASVVPPSLPQASVRMKKEGGHETIEQEKVDDQNSDEIDLDLPEASLPGSGEARGEVTTDSVPMTPHEIALALRDQEVGAALRRIQTGYVPEVEEPAAGEQVGGARDYSVAAGPAPWTWPLIVAIGATCMMLTSLYYILYLM